MGWLVYATQIGVIIIEIVEKKIRKINGKKEQCMLQCTGLYHHRQALVVQKHSLSLVIRVQAEMRI